MKHSFCFISNKWNDLVKLALDKNLREHDRVISPQGSLVRLKKVGKPLDATFVNYNAKAQVHTNCLYNSVFVKRCIIWKVMPISPLWYCWWNKGNTTKIKYVQWILIVIFVGKSDWMSTSFRIFRDELDIFTQYIDWLIDWIEFYAVSAIFQPCYGGNY